MNAVKIQHSWTNFFKFYGEQNAGRPARIGIFETAGGVTNDYWIENGLSFNGIDADFSGRLPVVEVMLEGLTHVIRDVRLIRPIYSYDGNEEGMDIICEDGTTTIVRFENS